MFYSDKDYSRNIIKLRRLVKNSNLNVTTNLNLDIEIANLIHSSVSMRMNCSLNLLKSNSTVNLFQKQKWLQSMADVPFFKNKIRLFWKIIFIIAIFLIGFVVFSCSVLCLVESSLKLKFKNITYCIIT